MSVFLGIAPLMRRKEIFETVKEALARKGLTAAEASKLAVGNDTLINNLSRERYGSPRVDSLMALAEVLDLELYFGPRRAMAPKGFAEEQAEFRHDGSAEQVELETDSVQEWSEVARGAGKLPLPTGLAHDQARYLHVVGPQATQVAPLSEAFLLITQQPANNGDMVVLVDREGRAALRRLRQIDDQVVLVTGTSIEQGMAVTFNEQWARSYLRSVERVIAAYAEEPKPGKRLPNILLPHGYGLGQAPRMLGEDAPLVLSADALRARDLDVDQLLFLTVPNDDMAPGFKTGDQVLIQRDGELPVGCVVAVEIKGRVSLKRQSPVPGHDAFALFNDNKDQFYGKVWDRADPQFKMLGRVIWHGTWLV